MIFAACAGAVLGPLVQSLTATSDGLAVLGQAALVTFIAGNTSPWEHIFKEQLLHKGNYWYNDSKDGDYCDF